MRNLLFCLLLILPILVYPHESSVNPLEIVQEAENNYTYSGPGVALNKQRGNASNQRTIWVNQTGGAVSWTIDIPASGDYTMVLRYSNDDTGTLDDVSVLLDGALIGGFTSEDTGNGGLGWDVFAESPTISLGSLSVGTIVLTLRLDAQDGFGIEYDKLTMVGTNIQAPPVPTLLAPANNTANAATNLSLSWNASLGNNTYDLELDNNSDFSSPEVSATGIADTISPVSNLAEGATYYWRVRAANICESSVWSTSWLFETECLATATITPDNSTTFCEGEGLLLTASGGNDYLWNTGATSPSINAMTSGTYSVVVSNSPTCTASDSIILSSTKAYYHPFQNFDDDVDRIKTFTNFFGGNNGIIFDTLVSPTSFIQLSYDTAETRTGYGRSLKIDYENINAFNIYTESFERKWFDNRTWLDLENLFPDFSNPAFQNRQIDSVVFYGKLTANQSLSLQVKLEDANGQGATIERFVSPSVEWQRFAFAIEDFLGNFDPQRAKFLGLNFDRDLGGNAGTSGTFFLDDIFLVENCYEKPTFSSDEERMQYLNEVAFRHFWMAVEPESKFALDRHVWDDLISVDAVGFSLSAYIIAHKNGWIAANLVESRVDHILGYLLDSCAHAIDTNLVKNEPLAYASVNGIWAHFLDHKTLSRKGERTEYSIFSTALLLAGVLSTAEYFDFNPSIVAKADALYRMTDWTFLLRPDGLMNYDWKPETGFSQYYTDWFSEELDLAFLLGIASPEAAFRLPANPYFQSAYKRPLCLDGDYIYSAPGANFTYYFLQMYARFAENTQRFQNPCKALQDDLAFCQSEYASLAYSPLIFGTTACEGPDSAGIDFIIGNDTTFISNYHAYGYCCKFDQHNTGNGTVATYGSGSAAPFMPQEVNQLWDYYYNDLDEQFWNEYHYRFWSPIFGMPDAFHLAPDQASDALINGLNFRGPWISIPRFGIDVGPMLMNIDSYLSETAGQTSLRDYFTGHPLIAAQLSQFETIIPTNELQLVLEISLLSDSIVCEGEELIFKAEGRDEGETPLFEWFLDGVLTQSSGDSLFSATALVGDHMVYCKLSSSEHCIEGELAFSDTLFATVLPAMPVDLTLSASDTTVCEGDSITLTANLTNGGLSPVYQWLVNGEEVGENNPVLTLYGSDARDTVICMVQSSEECATNNPASSTAMIIEFYALPAITFQMASTICAASPAFELTFASPTGGTYTGAFITNNVFDPGLAGSGPHAISYTYTDSVTNCSNTLNTVLFVESPVPAMAENTGPTCEGEQITLMASGGEVYQWAGPNGFSSNMAVVTLGPLDLQDMGVYSVTVSDVNGCTGIATTEVFVNELPEVRIDTLCLPLVLCSNELPFSLEGCGLPDGGTFMVDGAVSNTIDIPIPSSSSYIVDYHYVDGNNCERTVSVIVLIDCINPIQEDIESRQLNIFPNPSNGRFRMEVEGLNGLLEVSVFDLYGREVQQWSLEAKDQTSILLDLQRQATGIYLFRVKQGPLQLVTKVIIF